MNTANEFSSDHTKAITLPRLGLLTPTMDSTLLKIMEEAGELAREVLLFLERDVQGLTAKEQLLLPVAKELLDVAQTCVTMIFVLEEQYRMDPGELIGVHLEKLRCKGYAYDVDGHYFIQSSGQYKCLYLPKLRIKKVTLLKTVCKIQEEIGELTQILGKNAGRSGERKAAKDQADQVDQADSLYEGSLELLDIAQCCFTMLYILEDDYQMDMQTLLKQHLTKLKKKGYCA